MLGALPPFTNQPRKPRVLTALPGAHPHGCPHARNLQNFFETETAGSAHGKLPEAATSDKGSMLLGFYLQQVKDRVLHLRSEHVADQCQCLAQLGTSWHILASVCARFPGFCHWPLCQGARKASPHGFKTQLEQQPIATMVFFQTRGFPREPDKGGSKHGQR